VATGKAKGVYDENTTVKIVERGKILKPLLLGNKAPDLFMIDTVNAKTVNKMGYDTAKTQEGLTKLYQTNMNKLAQLYTTLYNTQAKYTVLVFWDVDCGHCKTEIPKLNETYKELKKKYDIKVIGVYTKHEYDKWRKYIIENKLEFINVWDPMHINNISDKYDIFSTPVIYVLDKDKIILSKKLSEEQIPDVIKVQEAIEKEKQKK
jgi:alkyl hydroperoxide reductase subunit AhpC